MLFVLCGDDTSDKALLVLLSAEIMTVAYEYQKPYSELLLIPLLRLNKVFFSYDVLQ